MNFVPRENCLPHQDDLVAYSLGALDAGDVAALELHLKDMSRLSGGAG